MTRVFITVAVPRHIRGNEERLAEARRLAEQETAGQIGHLRLLQTNGREYTFVFGCQTWKRR